MIIVDRRDYMVSLLLIISFLLHITLIMAVYHLYQQLQLSKRSKDQELEILFADFLKEIRIENERLQSQLINEPPPKNEGKKEEMTLTKNRSITNKAEHYKENNFFNLLQEEKNDQLLETSIESKIFSMYNQGQSIDDIAKTLNRGKTEVALILKLHSNKAENT